MARHIKAFTLSEKALTALRAFEDSPQDAAQLLLDAFPQNATEIQLDCFGLTLKDYDLLLNELDVAPRFTPEEAEKANLLDRLTNAKNREPTWNSVGSAMNCKFYGNDAGGAAFMRRVDGLIAANRRASRAAMQAQRVNASRIADALIILGVAAFKERQSARAITGNPQANVGQGRDKSSNRTARKAAQV